MSVEYYHTGPWRHPRTEGRWQTEVYVITGSRYHGHWIPTATPPCGLAEALSNTARGERRAYRVRHLDTQQIVMP